MNRLPRCKKPGNNWQKILQALALSGLLLSLPGTASAQQASELSVAQQDSVMNAFFLLQFDMKVAEAKWSARASVDSLHIADLKWDLQDARKQRYRDMLVFGIAAAAAGVIFYLGGRAAQ